MVYEPSSAASRSGLAHVILETLGRKGFQEFIIPGTTETVLAKDSTRLAHTRILVYTTIENGEVREIGSDSIKVCGVFMNNAGTRGLVSERRVYRTGDVAEIASRVVERIAIVAEDLGKLKKCDRCGSPMIHSKRGNLFCVGICWV